MRLCKFRCADDTVYVGLYDSPLVRPLDLSGHGAPKSLSGILHADDPAALVESLPKGDGIPLAQITILPPIDEQEVWAAGVTYKRSKVAREEESASSGGARFYDMVYTAPRPELFFKSPPYRVVGPGGTIRIRRDGKWNVPEPEATLVISPSLKIVGLTVGNDVSSRDIEGENPLYLPQAKMYDGSCAVGPVVTLLPFLGTAEATTISLTIERSGATAFEGKTSLASLNRTFEELVGWLGKEMSFPNGALLMTGTGIVPPDDFTLAVGDIVRIEIAGVGVLENVVG